MCPPGDATPFVSRIAYEQARIHAAAVYCSDGRIGEQFDDFLTNGLALPRYDRVALPGGPACIAGHEEARLEEEAVIDELRFLVEAHKLKRVVLIQHQGCAFYAMRLGLGDHMENAQRTDLVRAADMVRDIAQVKIVDAFFAHRVTDGVAFERVDV